MISKPVCSANVARSQLALALLRHTDSERFEAFSAGTAPTVVDPRTLVPQSDCSGPDTLSKSKSFTFGDEVGHIPSEGRPDPVE